MPAANGTRGAALPEIHQKSTRAHHLENRPNPRFKLFVQSVIIQG